MNVRSINEKRDNRVGLELLRAVMCFCVVLNHFWNPEKRIEPLMPIANFIEYAVPVFMFMSFFLMQKRFLCKDSIYNKKRLWRLTWPQIAWTIIYFAVYVVLDQLFGTDRIQGMSDFWWQLCTGHSQKINAAMWYQVVIILLTLMFFTIFYYLPIKIGLLCIAGLMFLAIGFQYSGFNYAIFSDLRYELKYPLGRFCEMVPYAVTAFYVAYFQIPQKMEKNRMPSLIGVFVITGILMNHSFIFSPEGFGYSGIQRIFIALGLIMIAWLFPFDKLPTVLSNVIVIISRYTLGIYCMHNLIGRFIKSIFGRLGRESETFFMCVIVYVTCYIIAFMISRIPIKLCKQLVE